VARGSASEGSLSTPCAPSLTQRVQINLAKSRQNNRVLKFADRRIPSAREYDNARMLVSNSARSTFGCKSIGRFLSLPRTQNAHIIPIERDYDIISDVHWLHVRPHISHCPLTPGVAVHQSARRQPKHARQANIKTWIHPCDWERRYQCA
jgi:hypothetical protein